MIIVNIVPADKIIKGGGLERMKKKKQDNPQILGNREFKSRR